MCHLESPFERLDVLGVLVALGDSVVASDDDLLGSDQYLPSLSVCFKRIVVSPLLEVLASDLLWAHFFDDDYLLLLVSIPPGVVGFDEGSWVCLSDMSRLASPCGTIMPFVSQTVHDCDILLHDAE